MYANYAKENNELVMFAKTENRALMTVKCGGKVYNYALEQRSGSYYVFCASSRLNHQFKTYEQAMAYFMKILAGYLIRSEPETRMGACANYL